MNGGNWNSRWGASYQEQARSEEDGLDQGARAAAYFQGIHARVVSIQSLTAANPRSLTEMDVLIRLVGKEREEARVDE
mgnify:FL=1